MSKAKKNKIDRTQQPTLEVKDVVQVGVFQGKGSVRTTSSIKSELMVFFNDAYGYDLNQETWELTGKDGTSLGKVVSVTHHISKERVSFEAFVKKEGIMHVSV